MQLDIKDYIHNPSQLQNKILELMSNSSNGEIELVDPNSPFALVLEANVSLTHSAISEMNTVMAKMFPSRSLIKDDLYHHISDTEMVNLFATPSTAVVTFMVNLTKLKYSGYISEDKTTTSVTIPRYTIIKVTDLKFTLLNDIDITVYNNSNKIDVEQKISDNELSHKDIGIIRHTMNTDPDGHDWIVFTVLAKELNRTITEEVVTKGINYKKSITISDNYHYSIVYMRNNSTQNRWVKVRTTHSDMVFDPTVPTMLVKILDNVITYELPEVYVANGSLSGNIKIVIYTTNGEIHRNLNHIKSDDITVSLGPITESPSTAAISNVPTLAFFNTPVDGGRDSKSLSELRESVVNNTTGINNVPITELELNEFVNIDGYSITKINDSVTDRLYLATRNYEVASGGVGVMLDIFSCTFNFMPLKNESSQIAKFNEDAYVIKSKSLFVEENGVVRLLSDNEQLAISNLNDLDMITTLKNNRYFVNPYHYISDIVEGKPVTNVYDFNRTKLSNLNILSKPRRDISVNIDKYNIYVTSDTYVLTFSIVGNDHYDALDKGAVKLQLSIPMISGTLLYYYGVIDPSTGHITITIPTSFYAKDGVVEVFNDKNPLSVKMISLLNIAHLILYTTDATVEPIGYDASALVRDDSTSINALAYENIELFLGEELKNVWVNTILDYSEREYRRYADDIPLRHEKDIYNIDPDTGSVLKLGDDGNYAFDIKYHANDIVVDDDNQPIMKHLSGDVIVDMDGTPVVDTSDTIIRRMDLMLVEYEFVLTRDTIHITYLNDALSSLNQMIGPNLDVLNSKLLNNTKLQYVPNRNISSLMIKVGDRKYRIPSLVSPRVTIYADKDSSIHDNSITYVTGIVGKIIHEHLNSNRIQLELIRKDIVAEFGIGTHSVKISGLDNDLNLEFFELVDTLSRLTMKKTMYHNTNNDKVLQYDIWLEMIKL